MTPHCGVSLKIILKDEGYNRYLRVSSATIEGMSTTTIAAAAPAVATRNLFKTYGRGEATVHALNNVTIDFERGKFTAIMGPSGSGKSTLMQTLATLDTPDRNPETSIQIGGTELYGQKDNQLTEFRREHVGFIFQAFNLVPTLTAGQNIDLPLGLAGKKPDPVWRDYLVKTLGLAERLNHRPEQLSGGQQQRVAIVRALLSRPEVVFADEPTGNLDSNSGSEVLRLLRDAATEHQQTILMVTHDAHAASYADRVVFLKDGMIAGEMLNPTHDAVLQAMGQLEGK